MGELSEDGPDDWEGLDTSAAHIANLLSSEPCQLMVLSATQNFANNKLIIRPQKLIIFVFRMIFSSYPTGKKN